MSVTARRLPTPGLATTTTIATITSPNTHVTRATYSRALGLDTSLRFALEAAAASAAAAAASARALARRSSTPVRWACRPALNRWNTAALPGALTVLRGAAPAAPAAAPAPAAVAVVEADAGAAVPSSLPSSACLLSAWSPACSLFTRRRTARRTLAARRSSSARCSASRWAAASRLATSCLRYSCWRRTSRLASGRDTKRGTRGRSMV